jgi:hypothetical protein
MTNKSQLEMEAPAKNYQVEAIAQELKEIKQLLISNNLTYVTKDALALALLSVNNSLKELQDKNKLWARIVWMLASALLYLLTSNVWQILMNAGKVK